MDEAEAFATAVDSALEQLAALKRQQSNSQTQESQALRQQQHSSAGNGALVSNHHSQQQTQPHHQIPMYREQASHFDHSNFAESGCVRKVGHVDLV